MELTLHPIFQHLIDQMRVAGLAPPEPPYSEPPRTNPTTPSRDAEPPRVWPQREGVDL